MSFNQFIALIKSPFKKKVVPALLPYNARIFKARSKVDDLFSGFITMESEIRSAIDEIQVVKLQAQVEAQALKFTIATAEEEIAIQTAMADNLLQFINPGAGANAQVYTAGNGAGIEMVMNVPNDEDETRG